MSFTIPVTPIKELDETVKTEDEIDSQLIVPTRNRLRNSMQLPRRETA